MAKSASTATPNRSQAIREYLKKHKSAGVKDIQTALKEQGIEASEALISKVKYGSSGKRKRGRKAAAKRAAASNGAEINKSEAIRQAFKKLGRKAPPKDVVKLLADKGVEVSSAQVSTIRSNMKAKQAARKPGAVSRGASAGSASGISIEDLLEAKRLAEQLGGVERLKAALAVLDQLK